MTAEEATVASKADAVKVTPCESDVVEAARVKLAEAPGLGIAKLLSHLQASNDWALSEKRLKSILTSANLRQQAPSTAANGRGKTKQHNGIDAAPSYVPLSHLDTTLNIPSGIRAVYFDRIKGKGLVADRTFREGETVFTEDAFVASPPSHAMQQMFNGELCAQCFAPLSGSLVVRCGQKDCDARFCTRLCQSRAQSAHHALLCPGQNPSIKPFNRFLSIQKWLSLAIVAKTVARILLTHSNHAPPSLSASTSANGASTLKHQDEGPKATLDEMLAHFDAFATVSELERRARNPGWDVEQAAFLSGMQEAHRLLCQGMDPRRTESRKGKWPLWNDFPSSVAERLFSWQAFLSMLGRANLNTEAQGGMYSVHSHLNHSCAPNITIRHPPSRHGVRQATKITAIAKRTINAGEELLITYQDPELPLARRRLLLWREYMFGPCACERCTRELDGLSSDERRAMDEGGAWMRDEREEQEVQKRKEHADMIEGLERDRKAKLEAEGKSDKDLSGVEDELRAHLGL